MRLPVERRWQLRLLLDASVARLPWQVARLPGGEPLVLHPDVTAGVEVDAAPRARETRGAPPRVLVITAAPLRGDHLDTDRELGVILDALDPLRGRAEVRFIDEEGDTLGALAALLSTWSPDVVHVGAHGEPGRVHLLGLDGGVRPTSPCERMAKVAPTADRARWINESLQIRRSLAERLRDHAVGRRALAIALVQHYQIVGEPDGIPSLFEARDLLVALRDARALEARFIPLADQLEAALSLAPPRARRLASGVRARRHGMTTGRRAPRALGGLVVGLALAEAVARGLLLLPPVQRAIHHRFGPTSDALAWLAGWEARGGDPDFVPDPELGWRPRDGRIEQPGWAATTAGGGLRAPVPPRARTPGRPRVAALGDSFTFGWDVDDDQTWQAALLGLRPDLEVVNLGLPSADLGQTLVRVRRDLPGWSADVVVLLLHPLLGQRTAAWFSLYERPIVPAERGVFEPVNTPIADAPAMARRLGWTPRLLMLSEMVAWRARGGQDATASVYGPRSRALLDRIVAEAGAQGPRVVIVWLALPYEVEDALAGRPPARWLPRCVDGATCADTTDALVAWARAGGAIELRSHYTPEANAIVARVVVDALGGRPEPVTGP